MEESSEQELTKGKKSNSSVDGFTKLRHEPMDLIKPRDAKLVYYYLCRSVRHPTNIAYCSIAEIAANINVCRRNVTPCLKLISDLNLIKITKINGRPNAYEVYGQHNTHAGDAQGSNDNPCRRCTGNGDTHAGDAQVPMQEMHSIKNKEKNKDCKNKEKEKKKKTPAPSGEDLVILYDKFYLLYPNKKNPDKAKKAFLKLKPSFELVETLMEALKKQIVEKELLRSSGKFVSNWPYPSTWLNGGRWKDEVKLTTKPPEESEEEKKKRKETEEEEREKKNKAFQERMDAENER